MAVGTCKLGRDTSRGSPLRRSGTMQRRTSPPTPRRGRSSPHLIARPSMRSWRVSRWPRTRWPSTSRRLRARRPTRSRRRSCPCNRPTKPARTLLHADSRRGSWVSEQRFASPFPPASASRCRLGDRGTSDGLAKSPTIIMRPSSSGSSSSARVMLLPLLCSALAGVRRESAARRHQPSDRLSLWALAAPSRSRGVRRHWPFFCLQPT